MLQLEQPPATPNAASSAMPFGAQALPVYDVKRGVRRLQRLLRACAGAQQLVVLTHNDPDPDALASAWAVRALLQASSGIEARIVYGGIIGRAENRAMVSILELRLTHVDKVDWSGVDAVVLVDTQSRATNHALPESVSVAAVFDHHNNPPAPRRARYRDVRTEYGSTSTILTEYLVAANLRPAATLATALFYGIKTDTRGLARQAADCDAWAYMVLLPLMDRRLLAQIEQAHVPREYFKTLNDTLARTVLYDNVVLASLGKMSRPDMAAEVADILTRLENADWVICWGRYDRHLVLAVRSQLPAANAARVVRQVVGDLGSAGGHTHMAGGRVPFGEDPDGVEEELRKRFLRELNVSAAAAQPLIT